MKRYVQLIILCTVPLLVAALGMEDQPSFKPYETTDPSPPAGSVPVTGREIVSPDDEYQNPVASTPESRERGKALFEINCRMCHGDTSAERGLVGKKLVPPPPGLDHELVQDLSDSTIFKAVTFGFGRMPPFRNKLIPAERWDLVNFLRTRE